MRSLLFLTTLVWFSAQASHLDHIKGKVVKVTDGDSIIILDQAKSQYRIRLLGIDAPERKQAFGRASSDSLAAMIAGKEIEIQFKKRDQYGRVLGKIIFNNLDVGLEQVRRGMAWHYSYYSKDQEKRDRETYAQAQEAARIRKQGLWHDPEPTPPWDFRRHHH